MADKIPQGAAIGVFTTDTALGVRTWDEWLAGVTGIPTDAARGRPLMELIPDLATRGLLAPFEQVLSRGVVEILAPAFHRYLIACRPVQPSASFDRMQQRVTIGPLREDGVIVGTIVAVEDVTARVEHERRLVTELSSSDAVTRRRAAERLADAELVDGPDPLLPVMGDENWQVRRAAVTGLGRRKTAEVIAGVLQALRDDHRNFSVLSSAIELLSATDVDIVQPLLDLLAYPDIDLRLQAALLLGERPDPRGVAALIDCLADPDENLRFHAIEALGKQKAAAAVEPLAAIAESGDFFLGFPALEALANIGDSSVAPRLAPLMKDDLLRSAVAETLGRIGDEDVVAPLTQLLNEATAPTEVVAEGLARVYDRYEERYREGEHIAQLVRRSISPTGAQNLLDAIQQADTGHLAPIAKVLGWLEGPAVDRALTRLLGQRALRGKIVEYLVRHGERVVDLLIEQLGSEDLEIRQAAVVGLGRIGDRRATPAMLDLLARDRALTLVIAGALARLGDPRAFEPLLELIGHTDPAVRQAVIAALNSIGHPGMAARIAPLLHDARPHVRQSAVSIAGYFGYRECADDLLKCRDDEDPDVRRAAVEHLPYLEDARVVPTLLDALTSGEAPVRAAAAQALARLDAPELDEPLLAATGDADPWVRYFATRALGQRRHAPAADVLCRLAFDDPAGQVRLAAADALGNIGDPAVIPTLSVLAASEDAERAAAAIRALGAIDHDDAWPPLRAAARSGDDDRRAAAADAVAQLGGDQAVELLQWMAAADASHPVIGAAVQGLAMLADGPAAEEAVRALVQLSADGDRRDIVIPALAALKPGLIESIAQGLEDPRPSVRTAVLHALGRMRHPEASKHLPTALDDPLPEVRLAALAEIRHLGTRGLERKLLTIARGDEDPTVRRAALAALESVPGSDDADAV